MIIKIIPRFEYLILLTAILIAQPLAAADKLLLTTGLNPPLVAGNNTEGFVESLARTAFGRLGHEIEVKVVPSKLALMQSNSGKTDGQLLRIRGINKTYKNLVMIPEAMMQTEFVAYSRKPIGELEKWQDLSQYEVSYVNGWRIFERNITDGPGVRKADDPAVLFKMLKENRTEIVLYEKWQGLLSAKEAGIEDIVINKLPVDKIEQFMWLHNSLEHLVKPAAAALKMMKQDGTYDEIFEKTLGHLLR
ncbi:MAG: transporter substrate-binding domain-containing protein [Gammaproteobacteria bacterium]|nr:transporter substrate-binding domain-containing protein [Gammaproteobacteria bacterium]